MAIVIPMLFTITMIPIIQMKNWGLHSVKLFAWIGIQTQEPSDFRSYTFFNWLYFPSAKYFLW